MKNVDSDMQQERPEGVTKAPQQQSGNFIRYIICLTIPSYYQLEWDVLDFVSALKDAMQQTLFQSIVDRLVFVIIMDVLGLVLLNAPAARRRTKSTAGALAGKGSKALAPSKHRM